MYTELRFPAPLRACPSGLLGRSLLTSGLIAAALAAQGQKPEEQVAKPVVVTATRDAADPIEVPFTTSSVTSEVLKQRAYRTVPQALRDVPGVMVQETAHGHGSPYIRGFTSFRNLFLIDGIRLNNSVFRPGPNQYWNTVDSLSLDRLEVVKGPSSVLYGSDAVGGTVQAVTKSPSSIESTGFMVEGRTYLRYSSAEDAIQVRGEFDLSVPGPNGSHTGILVGGTARSFGDLEGGGGVGDQPGTGYDENDGDLKIEHWFDRDTRLVFLHQRVAQNDVPRTHRTTDGIRWRGLSAGNDQRRDFDQDRQLTYLQFHKESSGGFFDALRANVSWHRQKEVRDRIRSNGNQELQGFDVGTLGVWLQLESDTPVGDFTYGFDFYEDDVDSFLHRAGNAQPADAIQGPVADDAKYRLFDVYLQDVMALTKALELTLGARFSYVSADADSVRDPVTSARIAIHDSWRNVVGSARLRFQLVPEKAYMFGGVSQGFRAPNLSDLSRFDSARSDEFEVPAPALDPEEYTSYEIGVKVRTEDTSGELAFFYMDIEDQILRYPTGVTNAAGEREVTKGNVGDGYVQGVELGVSTRLCDAWTAFGNATYIDGEVSNFENNAGTLSDTYLTRLMPLTMQAGIRWEPADCPVWFESIVVHAERADRLSFSDRQDTSRIPPGGTPAYTVWHWRSGWHVSESASFNPVLDNVTDVDYRVHGSGLNRPGRNLILGFSTTF